MLVQDLSAQLCKQLNATCEPAGWRTAWVVPTKARSANKNTAPRVASPGSFVAAVLPRNWPWLEWCGRAIRVRFGTGRFNGPLHRFRHRYHYRYRYRCRLHEGFLVQSDTSRHACWLPQPGIWSCHAKRCQAMSSCGVVLCWRVGVLAVDRQEARIFWSFRFCPFPRLRRT